MNTDHLSEAPPSLPEVFQPMMHNETWDYSEDPWPYNRTAPEIAIHGLRGQPLTYSQPQDARLFEGSSFVFRGAAGMDGAQPPQPRVTPPAAVRMQGYPPTITIMATTDSSPSPWIARPPAGRFIALVGRAITRPAFESMIAPFIAQEQHEYYEALLRKEFGYAKWIWIRMYLIIGYNLIAAVAASVINLVRRAG